jgi:hypothetical protein
MKKTQLTRKADEHKTFKDASVQCLIVDYRLDIRTASYLKIPENASFPLFRVEKLNKQNNNLGINLKKTSICFQREKFDILNIREVESQTYTSVPFYLFDEKIILDYDIERYKKSFIEICIEDLVFLIFVREKKDENSGFWMRKFISCLNKLSEDSIRYLCTQTEDETKSNNLFSHIKSIVKLNDERLRIFDLLTVKLIKNEPEIDLERLIKLAQSKQKDVRFETTKENKKIALDRFKRAVRLIMSNRECIKQFNRKKVEESEKVLLDKYENDFLDCKKIGLLFNKEEFRAQKNFKNILNDIHKNILITPSRARTKEQIESLIDLVSKHSFELKIYSTLGLISLG